MMNIELNKDEILILHDFLYRISKNEPYFEDIAEQQVLWHIEAQLEKELVGPSMSDYVEMIKKARETVKKTIEWHNAIVRVQTPL